MSGSFQGYQLLGLDSRTITWPQSIMRLFDLTLIIMVNPFVVFDLMFVQTKIYILPENMKTL